MLQFPSTGFGRSVNTHNVQLDALVEWIEGCITFDEEVLSWIDIVDQLMEEQLYEDQDFATGSWPTPGENCNAVRVV